MYTCTPTTSFVRFQCRSIINFVPLPYPKLIYTSHFDKSMQSSMYQVACTYITVHRGHTDYLKRNLFAESLHYKCRLKLCYTAGWCNSTAVAGPKEATELAVVELEPVAGWKSGSAAARPRESLYCKPRGSWARDAVAVENREEAAVVNDRPSCQSRPSSWPLAD